MSNKSRIYLDYASTTPLNPLVKEAMDKVDARFWANPSSLYTEGLLAKKYLDDSRKTVALCLGARPEEVVFTSGGTEANNLAIQGFFSALKRAGTKIENLHAITTNIEHSSVLNCFKALEKDGLPVTYVPVEANGIVEPAKIKKALQKNTVFVSVMYANNEIGTIQPIREISRLIRNFSQAPSSKLSALSFQQKPIFHTDACQAPLYLDMSVSKLGVDLLSIDAHKIYGPKGVGALYVKNLTPILPILFGGEQERGLRSTTENLPVIVGLTEALRLALKNRKKESDRLTKLRDFFFTQIKNKFPKTIINGDTINRLPNNVNVSFVGYDAEELLIRLDAKGIACSTKSSCLKDKDESYVVASLVGNKGTSEQSPEVLTFVSSSLGRHENSEVFAALLVSRNKNRASSSLRFTLGRDTSKKSVEKTLRALKKVLSR